MGLFAQARSVYCSLAFSIFRWWRRRGQIRVWNTTMQKYFSLPLSPTACFRLFRDIFDYKYLHLIPAARYNIARIYSILLNYWRQQCRFSARWRITLKRQWKDSLFSSSSTGKITTKKNISTLPKMRFAIASITS